MKVIKINTHEHELEFICTSRNTRTGFAHDCTLFINGYEETTAHCYYINRTWERWTYESVCVEAVDMLIKDYRERERRAWLDLNGFKKMTQKRTLEFNTELELKPHYQMLKACKTELMSNLY